MFDDDDTATPFIRDAPREVEVIVSDSDDCVGDSDGDNK